MEQRQEQRQDTASCARASHGQGEEEEKGRGEKVEGALEGGGEEEDVEGRKGSEEGRRREGAWKEKEEVPSLGSLSPLKVFQLAQHTAEDWLCSCGLGRLQ